MSLGYSNTHPYGLPLAENEIRLFRLFKYSDGSISGELQHFELQHSPPFVAASYVWGDQDERRMVKLNGHGVDILKTAHTFFEEMLAPDHYEHFPPSTTWWWMDCICINQTDLAEQSAQVGLMSTIYRQAAKTVIWLGEEYDGSNLGMGFLKLLAEDYTVRHEDEPYWTANIKPHIAANAQGWKAVEKLLTRKWWERVWTLQEFILGKDAVFFCGSKRIGLDQMAYAIHAVWEWHQRLDHKIISRQGYERAWNRIRILDWHNYTSQNSQHLPLIGILTYTATSSATDPRDRLYSLLGLISPTELDIIGRPDYESSAREIYINFARSFITRYRTLDLLCIAPEMKENLALSDQDTATTETGLDLPSWVPDWSLRRTQSPPILCLANQSANSHMGNFRPLHSLKFYREYRACGAADAAFPDGTVSFSKACKELFCVGIILGEIDGLGGGKSAAAGGNKDSKEKEGIGLVEMVQSTSEANNNPTSLSALETGRIRDELGTAITEQVARSLVLDRQDAYLGKAAPARAFAREFRRICPENRQKVDESFGTRSRVFLPQGINSPDSTADIAEWFRLNRDLKIRGMTLEEALTGRSDDELGHNNIGGTSSGGAPRCQGKSSELETPETRKKGLGDGEEEEGQILRKAKDGETPDNNLHLPTRGSDIKQLRDQRAAAAMSAVAGILTGAVGNVIAPFTAGASAAYPALAFIRSNCSPDDQADGRHGEHVPRGSGNQQVFGANGDQSMSQDQAVDVQVPRNPHGRPPTKTGDDSHDAMRFATRFRSTTFRRAKRLMVTSTGIIGMAPRRARKGDVVCVLLGCSIPLVLRANSSDDDERDGSGWAGEASDSRASSQGRRYTIVGEAYVDGYMTGEAVEDVNRGLRKVENITIT